MTPLDYGKKGNGSTFPPNQYMVIARVNSWNLVVVDNPFIRPSFLKKGAPIAQVYIDMVSNPTTRENQKVQRAEKLQRATLMLSP